MKNNVMQAYKIFNRDVEIAIRVFFLCKGIYGIASKDKEALSTLEKNTLSWNIILHSELHKYSSTYMELNPSH